MTNYIEKDFTIRNCTITLPPYLEEMEDTPEPGYFTYENEDAGFLMVFCVLCMDYPADHDITDPTLLMTSMIMRANDKRIFNFSSNTVDYNGYSVLRYTYEAEGQLGLTLNEYAWVRCDANHVINFIYTGVGDDMSIKKHFLEEFRNAIGTIRMTSNNLS